MEQLKFETMKDIDRTVIDKVTELAKTVENSDYIRVHSGKEAYGMVIIRYVDAKNDMKELKKQLDGIVESLDGEERTPGMLADLAALAIRTAKDCTLLAASAMNGMEELNREEKD